MNLESQDKSDGPSLSAEWGHSRVCACRQRDVAIVTGSGVGSGLVDNSALRVQCKREDVIRNADLEESVLNRGRAKGGPLKGTHMNITDIEAP